MGYYADKLREQLGSSADAEPAETVETPSETSEEVVNDNQDVVNEDQPSETVDQTPETEDQPSEEPKEDEPKEETVEEQPKEEKPDLSQLTKEEKATHAFQRQLSKMKEKHKAELEEQREALKKEFQQQFEDFKKSQTEKKEEEPVKTRDDFADGKGGDEAYIKYLTKQGYMEAKAEDDKRLAEQRAKEEAQRQQEAEIQAQRQQVADYFNSNAKTEFGDSYGEFEKRLQKGVSNGLAEVLEEAPAVRDFIFSTPDGPLVLNEMLQDRDAFVRVMSRGSNPTLAIIECHDLAREVRSKRAIASQPVETAPKMPRMGKPGAGSSRPTAPDIYNDPAAMLEWVHNRRNR